MVYCHIAETDVSLCSAVVYRQTIGIDVSLCGVAMYYHTVNTDVSLCGATVYRHTTDPFLNIFEVAGYYHLSTFDVLAMRQHDIWSSFTIYLLVILTLSDPSNNLLCMIWSFDINENYMPTQEMMQVWQIHKINAFPYFVFVH